MSLAIKKDFDRVPWTGFYSFLRENRGLSLFCSWMSHREIGMADGERMVLWDQSMISCSGVFVRQSSQMKNLSSKTNPLWCSWRWNFCLHISHVFSEIRTPPKPLPIAWGVMTFHMMFIYKILLDEKEKKERGMGCKGKWKVAEMPAAMAGMSSVTQGQLLMVRTFLFIYFEKG